MTRPNFTSINIILDESGSMMSLWDETISGLNKFIQDQKQEPGEAVFTLVKFNYSPSVVQFMTDLKQTQEITRENYTPSGGTALLDAVGVTMTNIGEHLAQMKEEDRPDKVIVVIITDGEENSSRTYTGDQIRRMVERQKTEYNWEFVFLGANIDAVGVGTSLGLAATNTANYAATRSGMANAIGTVSTSMSNYRAGGQSAGGYFAGQTDAQGNLIETENNP